MSRPLARITSELSYVNVLRNEVTDPGTPLASQPLPPRPGVSGRTYAEGSLMIMQAISAYAHCPVLMLRIDESCEQLSVIATYHTWEDALAAMDSRHA